VLTVCGKAGCQFQWDFAVDAIGQLTAIERSRSACGAGENDEQARTNREEALKGSEEPQ
jgi:hypothetical protein